MTLTGRTRKAKLFREATKFFYENAGYSYKTGVETAEQGHKRCARSLARAERFARENGFSFEWTYDENGCSGCDCAQSTCACSTGENHETFICVARDHEGQVFASLGSICVPTPEYKRVIEADLSTEYKQ